jgi:iron-sulfur cluster insertion protein
MSVITTNIRKPDAAAEQVPVVPVAATSPILLTEVAAKKVQEIRDQESIEESMFLRVRIVGGGCSGFSYDLYFDTSTPMDKQLQSNGVTVIIDQMSLQYLRGTEIDYVEGLQGAGFKFHNPNVKSTCGCGSSFSV